MTQETPSVLSEIKALLDQYNAQNINQNTEVITLCRALVERIEPMERELFNSEGIINEIEQRLYELEEFVKAEQKKKERWKKIIDGAMSKVVSWAIIGAIAAIAVAYGIKA